MSHLKERKEKVCLNCLAEIQGRFCHVCGQENIETKESFWHLTTHFVYDITHFDGKFFSTLKYLLFRPGFLSQEYLSGRRADYLHPIRMYVFTSAFFFLIFFSFYQTDVVVFKDDDTALNGANTSKKNQTVGAYDSAQLVLAPDKRDNFFERTFNRQKIYLNNKYKNDGKAVQRSISDKFIHLFPQMLFISLPLFALLLQLLYVRQKKFYYVNHVVYSIHLYCATFILILVGMWMQSLFHLLKLPGAGWSNTFFTLGGFFYWYKGLRNFYGQGRGKTILKYILVLVLSLFIMMILFLTFLIFSALTV